MRGAACEKDLLCPASARELLRRRADADDCRLVLVNLTPVGKKLMRRLMQDFIAEEAPAVSASLVSTSTTSRLALSTLCNLAQSPSRSDI
jgi:DNA-binding MarR family transcriptional regulator